MARTLRKINQDFFKTWSSDMAYVLGYFVADGCISESADRISNPYTFNITSKDLRHLYKIRKVMGSNYKISKKFGWSRCVAYQIQVRNSVLVKDLINLGIKPKKTFNLEPLNIPEKYFPDYVRGFFDGDGSVYIYNVNNTPQLKSGFVAVSDSFIKDFNKRLCSTLKISEKSIHKVEDKRGDFMTQYNICFYVSDSEKLEQFMYGNGSTLYLDRKRKVFDKWKSIARRHYNKENYPSKVGWHLNQNLSV